MKYCARLFSNFILDQHNMGPCCGLSLVTSSAPLLPRTEGLPDIDSYCKFIGEAYQSIREGTSRFCLGCQELVDVENNFATMPEFRFTQLNLNVQQYLCNCKCLYCEYLKTPSRHEEFNFKNFLNSFINHRYAKSLKYVTWSGGEPSLYKNISESISLLHENNIHQTFFTNAIRFSRDIAKALSNGNALACISIDTGSPEVYKKIKGVDCFSSVVVNTKKYLAIANNPRNVALKFIFLPENSNTNDVLLFFRVCLKLGILVCYCSVEMQSLRPSSRTDLLFIIAFFLHAGRVLGLWCGPFETPANLITAAESIDLDAWSRENGSKNFVEYIYKALGSGTDETEAALRNEYREITALELGFGNVDRPVLVDINTREAFRDALSSIQQSYEIPEVLASLASSRRSYFLPANGKMDCSINEYLQRRQAVRWREFFPDNEFYALLDAIASNPADDRPFSRALQKKLDAYVTARARELEGQKVWFWGAGTVYHQYKSYFSKAKPLGILLDRRYASSKIGGTLDKLTVYDPEDILPQHHSCPVVIFSRAYHLPQLVHNITESFSYHISANNIYVISLQ